MNSITSTLAHLRHRFNHAFERGDVVAKVHWDNETPNLVLTLAGRVDERFFHEARRRLPRAMRHTTVSLTLRLEHFDEHQLQAITGLLKRLQRYGEQLRIHLNEPVRNQFAVDTTRVRLILDPFVCTP